VLVLLLCVLRVVFRGTEWSISYDFRQSITLSKHYEEQIYFYFDIYKFSPKTANIYTENQFKRTLPFLVYRPYEIACILESFPTRRIVVLSDTMNVIIQKDGCIESN